MTLVVDASVVVKWYIPEALSNHAGNILTPEQDLIAPDFLMIEVSNVLWKKVTRNEIKEKEAHYILEHLRSGFLDLMPIDFLVERAFDIGGVLSHPIYDCLYLALAEKEKSKVVTADEKFIACCKKTEWEGFISFIGNW
jgi:predicted nucleic acid-binding protein